MESSSKSRLVWILAGVLVVAGIFVAFRSGQDRSNPEVTNTKLGDNSDKNNQPSQDSESKNKLTDNSKDNKKSEPSEANHAEEYYGKIGKLPRMKAVDFKHIRKFLADAKKYTTGENMSPMIPASKKFDPQLMKSGNEKAYNDYLASVIPGRVWEAKRPANNVKTLKYLGRDSFIMKRGETVTLKILAEPDSPVTFTSFDASYFAKSGMTSITVKADKRGVATTEFFASTGTYGDVRILAACPLCSKQIEFKINIQK